MVIDLGQIADALDAMTALDLERLSQRLRNLEYVQEKLQVASPDEIYTHEDLNKAEDSGYKTASELFVERLLSLHQRLEEAEDIDAVVFKEIDRLLGEFD